MPHNAGPRRRGAGLPKRLKVLKKSPHMRRWLLRNPWTRPMCAFNLAIIIVQKYVRGFLARRAIKHGHRRPKPKSTRKKFSSRQLDKYLRYLDDLKRGTRGKVPWLNGGFSSWCAVRIQAQWRMFAVRRRFRTDRFLISQVAAIVLQAFWKDMLLKRRVESQKVVKRLSSPVEVAALQIQRCWRAFCCKRIFRYFRDLIKLKLMAAPIDLLRTIIPQEAHSLDRASGVHVRFRLGGRMFPPKLFFKIYTHRPLCDVNAFAPRCYAKERPVDVIATNNKMEYAKLRVRKGLGVKVGVRYFDTVVRTTCEDGTASWYKRDDKNTWRAVASQLLSKVAPPPWFMDAVVVNASKPNHFHFDRQHRKQDSIEARKRRKRQWLMKLYGLSGTRGLDASNPADEDLLQPEVKNLQQPFVAEAKLLGQNAAEFRRAAESKYAEAKVHARLPSKEADAKLPEIDLVKWSLALDYDNYIHEWKGMGTSLPSDLSAQAMSSIRRK